MACPLKHSVLVNTSHVYIHCVFILSACVPLEPDAVQGIEVTKNTSTSVEVNWMASVAPTDFGNTINGYEIELFIVDVAQNTSNRTETVDNVISALVEMLCELEFCGTCLCVNSLHLCYGLKPIPVFLSTTLVCCNISCVFDSHLSHLQSALTGPGVPYFVEVAVNESQRGIGMPGRSDEFFSEELGMCGADPLIECVRGHPRGVCVKESLVWSVWRDPRSECEVDPWQRPGRALPLC